MTRAAETEVSNTLPQLLADERDAIARFIELFKREEASLRQGGSDEIFLLVSEKETLATQLRGITAQRCAWLAGQGLTPDRNGIETWCASHPEAGEVLNRWSEIVTLAGEARELQRLNGELIGIHMRHNTQALEALQRGTKPLDLYGPDGQPKATGERRINDAV